MKPYHNSASGIDGYDYGDDWIHVRFKGGKIYEYRSPAVASHHMNSMKQLADSQDDLNTYISQHRDVYEAGTLMP
tara:strand:+ start:258 stop:482 length:225 start_codon:yes stop_codon:yes gene_type:complete